MALFDLVVRREQPCSYGTFGQLCLRTKNSVTGSFELHRICYTLEPTKVKVPSGEYGIILSPSPKFKKFLPYVQKVPGATGIRIHSGNLVGDTDGCLLVGLFRNISSLRVSRPAVDMVISLIKNFNVKSIIYE